MTDRTHRPFYLASLTSALESRRRLEAEKRRQISAEREAEAQRVREDLANRRRPDPARDAENRRQSQREAIAAICAAPASSSLPPPTDAERTTERILKASALPVNARGEILAAVESAIERGDENELQNTALRIVNAARRSRGEAPFSELPISSAPAASNIVKADARDILRADSKARGESASDDQPALTGLAARIVAAGRKARGEG